MGLGIRQQAIGDRRQWGQTTLSCRKKRSLDYARDDKSAVILRLAEESKILLPAVYYLLTAVFHYLSLNLYQNFS